MRLLSFLADVERSLGGDSPVIHGGPWIAVRQVNFRDGIARVSLASHSAGGEPIPRGAILVQSLELADHSQCVRATLKWQGAPESRVMAVYSTPLTNWGLEASKVAAAWLDGPAVITAGADAPAPLRATA